MQEHGLEGTINQLLACALRWPLSMYGIVRKLLAPFVSLGYLAYQKTM